MTLSIILERCIDDSEAEAARGSRNEPDLGHDGTF